MVGDPDRARDLLRYLGAELATSQWVDDVEVVLVGFSPEDTDNLIALDEERVRAAVSLTDALDRAQRRAAANAAAIGDIAAGSAFAGRVNDIIADAWMPHILLVADPDGIGARLAALDTQMQQRTRCAVAVAAVSATPSTWSVHVDATGELSVDWLSLTDASATRLPADQLARLASAIQAARTTLPTDADGEHGYDGVDEPVPPATEDEPWAHGTDAHGHLVSPDEAEPSDAGKPPATPERATPHGEPADTSTDVSADVTPAPADESTTGPPAAATQSSDLPRTHQPVLVIAGSSRAAPIPATISPRRRVPADPDLDADLAAWHLPDATRPRIAILGPVTVEAPGQRPADRPRFYAEILVYLAQRGARGATADQVDDALWPERRISDASGRVAITKARRWLGEDAEGNLWLPPNAGPDRLYRLAEGVHFDWNLFRRLRSRGESRGAAGLADLRRALELVRGAPLAGADRAYASWSRNPYTWLPGSDVQPHHLTSAIVDTAHQLVDLYLTAGDTVGARWAVDRAWLAEPDRLDDHPWLDLMRIAREEGHTSELRALLGDLVRVREVEVPEELSPQTYAVLNELMGDLLRVG